MFRNILIGLIFFCVFVIGLGAADIRYNNIKNISLGTPSANAGFLDDITDAIGGHIDDYRDRSKADEFVMGEVIKTSDFTWSSDSIHYVNGSVSIVKNEDGMFVQLNKDHKSGLAPDLHIYIAKGHIDSDKGFKRSTNVELGKLVKGSGASFYKVPSYLEGYSGEKFSIVIHCKRFNEPMGAAHFN